MVFVQPFVVGPADHVVVERAGDVQFVGDRAAHELAAAEESGFFPGERGEHDGRRLRVPGQDPRCLEQRRGAGRVVVRAGADQHRIEVAADDVDELGVDGALERRDHVRGPSGRPVPELEIERLIFRRIAE